MSESRIQDWIRYVQERAENVPEDAASDAPARASSPVGKMPAAAPSAAATEAAAPPIAVQVREEQATPQQKPPGPDTVEAAGTTARRARRLLPRGVVIPSVVAPPAASQPAASAQSTRATLPVIPPVNAGPAQNDSAPTHASDARARSVPTRVPVRNHKGGVKSQSTGQRQRQRPETRAQLLERLTNPTISLHETSVLLGVCSATVRRYTNSGLLPHARTEGGQRRFRLREVLLLMRELEAKRKH